MENWPLPPFFKRAHTETKASFAEALVFNLDGSSQLGQLQDFDPQTRSMRFKAKGEFFPGSRRFANIKSVQLVQPVALAGGASVTASETSSHLKTNVEVIEKFRDARFWIDVGRK